MHLPAGVKVDVQNQLELVGSAAGQQGGQVVAQAWHSALEDSVAAHFPGNALINCMCHNTSVSSCLLAFDFAGQSS
jgi:raffinose synthase